MTRSKLYLYIGTLIVFFKYNYILHEYIYIGIMIVFFKYNYLLHMKKNGLAVIN